MPRSDAVIGRRVAVPHAGVADERDVGLQLVAGCAATKSGRFLEPSSSSPSTRKVMPTGSAPVDRLPGPAGLDEGHHLALVVAGAARADDLAPVRQRRHAAARRAASPTGRADRPAARRNGRRTARAARPALGACPSDDRMAGRLAQRWPRSRAPARSPFSHSAARRQSAA